MRYIISFVTLYFVLAVLLMTGCAEPMPIRANYLPVDSTTSWPAVEHEPAELALHEDSITDDSDTAEKKPDMLLYEPEDGLDFITPPMLLDINEMAEGFDILSHNNTIKPCSCPNEAAIQPVVYSERDTKNTTPKQSKGPVIGVVNINTAPVETLVLLPGIGPSLAERIVAYRAKRKFTQPTHLRRVKGIGRMKFEKLKAHVVVSGETTLSR